MRKINTREFRSGSPQPPYSSMQIPLYHNLLSPFQPLPCWPLTMPKDPLHPDPYFFFFSVLNFLLKLRTSTIDSTLGPPLGAYLSTSPNRYKLYS